MTRCYICNRIMAATGHAPICLDVRRSKSLRSQYDKGLHDGLRGVGSLERIGSEFGAYRLGWIKGRIEWAQEVNSNVY